MDSQLLNQFTTIMDSRKSWQKMVKNTANFCEKWKSQKSWQNHGKVTGLNTIVQSIKLNI